MMTVVVTIPTTAIMTIDANGDADDDEVVEEERKRRRTINE